MSEVWLVSREPEYSPGQERDDRVILELVDAELSDRGTRCRQVDPSSLTTSPGAACPDLILAMCQSEAALRSLRSFELAGVPVINRPDAITRTVRRTSMLQMLIDGGLPVPATQTIATDQRPHLSQGGRLWIKRGDVHRMHPRDVACADNEQSVRTALADLRRRNCDVALVQQHVPGTLLKCYGVGSMIVWPPWLGPPQRELAVAAAVACRLEVYGVDLVTNGALTWVVDVNDWPSFAACRRPSTTAIAALAEVRLGAAREADAGRRSAGAQPDAEVSR